METISNIAGAASKAIWGESNEEPTSGEQGAGTKEAPYDQGNEDAGDNAGAKSSLAAGGNTDSNTGSAPPTNDAPVSGVDSSKDKSGPSEAQPSDTTGDPSSAQKPEQKQQGADKPAEDPVKMGKDGRPEMPHTDSQREALVNSGKDFPRDPNDHSGEPLKVHDGGEKKSDPRQEGEEGEGGTKPRSASVSQEGGDPHGGNKGTGEQYVKSTGLEADGGDFDAVNPGAGAEATRLQEEKGIKKDKGAPAGPAGGDSSEPSTPGGGDKPKVSKLQKIKDKLHIGSGKDLDK